MGAGAGKVLAELVGDEEDDVSAVVEGEGSGEVGNLLEGEARETHGLDDVEGGPGHVEAVEGVEVGELVEGGGLGVGVGGLDLASDLVQGLGEERGLGEAQGVDAKAFD